MTNLYSNSITHIWNSTFESFIWNWLDVLSHLEETAKYVVWKIQWHIFMKGFEDDTSVGNLVDTISDEMDKQITLAFII